jgi:hypothetical protein
MRDVSKLKFIGESFCSQYQSQAKFYIDEAHTSGLRHLVVVYENGDADFLAGIPDEWADENVQDFIFWPMKNPNSPYPLGRCRRAPMAVRRSMLGGRAALRFSEKPLRGLRNSPWIRAGTASADWRGPAVG